MKPIAELTKDCPREDCRITGGDSGTSTLLAYTAVYDKHGKRLDSGDPNIFTTSYQCSTCKKGWTARTQYGETRFTEHGGPAGRIVSEPIAYLPAERVVPVALAKLLGKRA